MNKALFFGFNAAYIASYSLIANLLGKPNFEFKFPTSVTNPEATNIFEQILAPLSWAFEALGILLGMIGYAFVGVDPLIFTLAIGPLFVIDLVLIVSMVRGGS